MAAQSGIKVARQNQQSEPVPTFAKSEAVGSLEPTPDLEQTLNTQIRQLEQMVKSAD